MTRPKRQPKRQKPETPQPGTIASTRSVAHRDLQPAQGDNTTPAPKRAASKRRLLWMLMALGGLAIAAVAWGLPTYWTIQAKKSLASGRYSDAEAYYQRLEHWQSRNVDAVLGQARAARHAGEHSRAKTLLSAAESRGAASSRIQLERDLLRIQSGGSPQMLDRLPGMLNRFPEYGAEILEAFAVGFEMLGASQQAMLYVDKWIEGAPHDARALQYKAELLATLENTAEAEKYFEAALREDPTLARAREGLARLKMEAGESEQALALYDVAITENPQNIDLQLLRCNALFDLRRDEEAIAGLRKVLLLDPSNFVARHSLASKLAERGQHQDVVQLIEPLMDEFGDDVSLNYLLASAYTELGETAKGEEHLQRHLDGRKQLNDLARLKEELRTNQSDGAGILRLGEGYLKYQWDAAEPWLVKALIALPRSEAAYRAMASFHRKKGDHRRADEFTRAANALAG